MYSNGVQAYRTTNVITADPNKLVTMCYEGALENLRLGKARLEERDYEGKARAFIKSREFISELQGALNLEKGGAIARNLDALYSYMLVKILEGDLNKNTGPIDEVIGMLRELLSAWEEIATPRPKNVQPASTFRNAGMSSNPALLAV